MILQETVEAINSLILVKMIKCSDLNSAHENEREEKKLLKYNLSDGRKKVVGITTSIIQTRKNQKNLKGTVHSLDTAIVCRGNSNFEQIPTSDLVPGDVILIPSNGCELQCDAVLLSGNCIVNESMLT
ncbi:hypothetical protein NQ314_010528, partial [Rhamnusium bicolor]